VAVHAHSPEEVVVDADLAAALMARLSELMCEAPRAYKQIKAVLLKFLDGRSDLEIAAELQIDVGNVYVLRSRGLKHLRTDPILKQLFLAMVER
jgi:DNA-directed RNA polymerase specialized sigma24 family protein